MYLNLRFLPLFLFLVFVTSNYGAANGDHTISAKEPGISLVPVVADDPLDNEKFVTLSSFQTVEFSRLPSQQVTRPVLRGFSQTVKSSPPIRGPPPSIA